jgi:CheY-like chemotaxis protein
LKDGDEMRDSIEEIQKAGERAAGLTRQLLAFSRKQALEPCKLDVNRLVKDMRAMLERLVGEDIEVSVALHAEGGTIHADPNQLEQVVMNLVANARDAMPGNGKLLVETANVELDEEYARAHLDSCEGRYVMLAVSDTGVGIDEETKSRIFEPFFSTKGVGKGTGLGLSIVQGIVAQSGGYIEVSSEKDKGTTFKIYLPEVSEPPTSDTGRASAVPVMGGKETVLVVEDQAEVRKFAVAVLKSYGYRTIPATSAGEALLQCERERIDLVLTDVVMPHVNGRELADRLQARQPGLKVLFMSGYADNVIEHHGVLEAGGQFIQKPFRPEELAQKVRTLLGQAASDDLQPGS